jgi:hypothetical protein
MGIVASPLCLTGASMSTYPLQDQRERVAAAKNDKCPECGGELDTGWECNDCGFDAMSLAFDKTLDTLITRAKSR